MRDRVTVNIGLVKIAHKKYNDEIDKIPYTLNSTEYKKVSTNALHILKIEKYWYFLKDENWYLTHELTVLNVMIRIQN